MKNVVKASLLIFFLVLLNSCSKDTIASSIIEEEPISEEPVNTATTPCDFNLSNIKEGQKLIINCVLDLEKKEINIPKNVTFIFDKGEIKNGILNFLEKGIIDGELLNASLITKGDVKLSKNEFEFIPNKWDIIEGRVNNEIARKNRDILEKNILYIKDLGASKFSINKMDAFFKVDGFLIDGVPAIHAINIPSDFHLSMTDNTHIRMQPNGHFRPTLLAIYDARNIIISGGNLHGDRDTHNYNSNFVDSDGATGPTHEWGHTMEIKGGQNITIDGVTFNDPTGDGVNISGIYHYFDTNHIKSENIVLKNNTFKRARRTNLVITSGEEIYIENNEFIDGGIDTQTSKATAPSSNINLEPSRFRDTNTNELIEYERVSHVYIRNNKQIVNDIVGNPNAGGFQLSHGNGPIIVEDNEMINTSVSFTTTDGVIIRRNKITQGSITAGSTDNFDRTDFVFGNEIYENTIITDKTALIVAGNGVIVKNNTLQGATAIDIGPGATDKTKGTSNAIIEKNILKASNVGIRTINTMKNVNINNNTIEMLEGANFALVIANEWNSTTEESNFIIKNNTITGVKTASETGAPPCLIGANYVTITENHFGDVQINGGSNINLTKNNIDANIGASGIAFSKDAPNSIFSNNNITTYPSKTPLSIKCIETKNGITLSNSVITTPNNCIEK